MVKDLPGKNLKEIANSLINRKLTGHAARDEIINLMSKS